MIKLRAEMDVCYILTALQWSMQLSDHHYKDLTIRNELRFILLRILFSI